MKTLAIHHTVEAHPDTSTPDIHQDSYAKATLGFWMYLMTDCILFACFFLCYAVLRHETFGGPSARDLFDLKTAFTETMILLVSSLSCGMAMLASLAGGRRRVLLWLAVTFLLGASFLTLEIHEFYTFVSEGHSWTKSAFLSSFFSLVGLHGSHITVGLFWLIFIAVQIAFLGINVTTFKRLSLFSMFWHFLDLIWIFIFTFVYLMGVMR